MIYYVNVNDLKTMITNPEKTILFSHVPARGEGKNDVDWAHFYEKRKYRRPEGGLEVTSGGILLTGQDETQIKSKPVWIYDQKECSVIPRTYDEEDIRNLGSRLSKLSATDKERNSLLDYLESESLPTTIYIELEENRGYEELKVPAGLAGHVTGHFHESVGNATGRDGQHVEPNTFTRGLKWNASYLDGDKEFDIAPTYGILTVRSREGENPELAYENLTL